LKVKSGPSSAVGVGSQGTILSGFYGDTKVAIKLGTDISVLHEHAILRTFDHPCILKTYGWGTVTMAELRAANITAALSDRLDEDSYIFFALYEYCEHKDLKTLLKTKPQYRTDVEFLCGVFRDISAALEVVHDAGYLHCDVKPDNILLDKDLNAKLADFGLTQKITCGMVTQGTPSFLCPEMLNDWFEGKPSRKCLWNAKADVFSLGVTIATCITGSFPFDRITAKLKLRRGMTRRDLIRHFQPPRDMIQEVCDANSVLSKIVLLCIKFNHEDRPHCATLKAMFAAVLVRL
jgi:serine/threonine protein kinase